MADLMNDQQSRSSKPVSGRFRRRIEELRSDEMRYISRSVLLKESLNPKLQRFTIWFIFALIIFFFVWASMVQMDEVAMAEGEVMPPSRVQKIQHRSGGLIKQNFVKEGDFVKGGQTLMLLDPVISESEQEQTKKQLEGNKIVDARINTFLSYAKARSVNPKVRSAAPFTYADGADPELIREQELILQYQVTSYNAKRSILERQFDFIASDAAIKKKLADKGLMPKLEYMKVAQDLDEAAQRLLEFDAEINKNNLLELATAKKNIDQLEAALKRNNQIVEQLAIKAPISGFVHELTMFTIGGVIAPGEVIMKIVPKEDALMAEVRISQRDIGHVAVGQKVILKFASYMYGRYGGVNGKLKDISSFTSLTPRGEPYYKGTVALEKSYVGDTPGRNKIISGMALQADIKTGSRTLLEFIFNPIYKRATEAMHER